MFAQTAHRPAMNRHTWNRQAARPGDRQHLRTPLRQGSTRPATRADASAVQTLTREALIQHFRDGCTPRDQFGTEHEKLGINVADGSRINYDQVRQLLLKIKERFGWEPIMEGENIIGVKLDGQSVTLEPGGQFELSGAPVDTLHKTCAEVNNHLYQVKTIADELGVQFLGVGFDPRSTTEQVPIMPKQRYDIMRAYMPTRGNLGLDMMLRSTTIQVNIDYEDERDMIEKFRIGLALQPVATALFANSPFKEGKPTGWLSWRSHVWTDTDPDRCGRLEWVWDDDFGFAKYVDYVLDVPMYFVYRNGTYVDASGMSFRDFMKGELPCLPGEYPSMKDWDDHLSTVFPEVRMKKYILEMRGADGGPWGMICALPALWVGLLYDADVQRQAMDLIADWTPEEHDYLRAEVPRTALKTPFRDSTVQDLALKVLDLAKQGLIVRGKGEESFLERLHEVAASGVSPAEQMLAMYRGGWKEDVSPLFSEVLIM